MMSILLFIFATVQGKGSLDAKSFSHVFVLPDIHGDLEALLRSLWLGVQKIESKPFDYDLLVEVFGSDDRQLPGIESKDVLVVQLGDVVDRGPHGKACMHILGMIESVLGWKYIQLYGNHEIMNFLNRAGQFIHKAEMSLYNDDWGVRMNDFIPGGEMHSMITERALGMFRISGGTAATLFVHGGVDVSWLASVLGVSDGNVEAINTRIREMASKNNETDLFKLNHETSVLWTRDFAENLESWICPFVESVKQKFNVHRIIVGHTPQQDKKAKTRCHGGVLLTDVQMSRWMSSKPSNGRPVAVIMTINRESGDLESIVAHYTDLEGTLEEEAVLFPEKHRQKLIYMPSHDSTDTESLDEKYFVIARGELWDDNVIREEMDGILVQLADVVDDEFPVDRSSISLLSRYELVSHIFIDTIIVHPHAALVQGVYGGSQGVGHIYLVDPTEDIFNDIAIAIGLEKQVVDWRYIAGSLLPNDLNAEQSDKYQCFFRVTSCVNPLERGKEELVTKAKGVLDRVASQLHQRNLLLGFHRDEDIVKSLLVNHNGMEVEFADWSYVRRARDENEILAERDSLIAASLMPLEYL
jgi:hypothetical protein